jgi:hypothetical protein
MRMALVFPRLPPSLENLPAQSVPQRPRAASSLPHPRGARPRRAVPQPQPSSSHSRSAESPSRSTPEQARRHDVRPGITGWVQVNGRNAIAWEEKFKLDVWYVDHHTLWLDLRILALTVLQVFQRKDISAAGHATMPEFTGPLPPERRHPCRLPPPA